LSDRTARTYPRSRRSRIVRSSSFTRLNTLPIFSAALFVSDVSFSIKSLVSEICSSTDFVKEIGFGGEMNFFSFFGIFCTSEPQYKPDNEF